MEDRKKKIIILTSIMIVILIIAILLGIKLASLKKNDKQIPINSNQETNNTVETENIIENTIENNEIEEEINNTTNKEIIPEKNEQIIEDKKPNKENKPDVDSEQEVDKEVMDKEETDIEKAIRIAEENYSSKNVEFTYEGIENGKYIIYVRDEGTRHIATFKIDIDNETFEILQ